MASCDVNVNRLAWESQSLSRQLEVSRKEECTVMKEAITGIRENGLALTPMFGCDHYEWSDQEDETFCKHTVTMLGKWLLTPKLHLSSHNILLIFWKAQLACFCGDQKLDSTGILWIYVYCSQNYLLSSGLKDTFEAYVWMQISSWSLHQHGFYLC